MSFYAGIYEEAVDKALSMCCPACNGISTLHYADDTVLVCENCQYSIEDNELQPEWQEKLEREYSD